MSEELRFFDPEELEKSSRNVRRSVDKLYVERLAENIAQVGLQNYPIVRLEGGKYKVVAGWARTLAVRKLKSEMPEVYRRLFPKGLPCRVMELSDREALMISLSENIHTRTLTAEEIGAAVEELRKLGLSEDEIERRLRLASREIKQALEAWEAAKKAGVIPAGRPGRPPEKRAGKRRPPTRKIVVTAYLTARRLARKGLLEDEEEFARRFVKAAVEAGLSGKEVERASRMILAAAGKGGVEKPNLDWLIQQALEKLRREDMVERVVAFRRRVADAVSELARRRGVKFDDIVNELLEAELKRLKEVTQ